MQVLHLAGADAFWCVLVVLTARVTIGTRVLASSF
jgi:general stress protein CsbA